MIRPQAVPSDAQGPIYQVRDDSRIVFVILILEVCSIPCAARRLHWDMKKRESERERETPEP